MLEIGTKAPKFTLHATPDQKISLDELKGSRIVLAFYPADWSPVCSDEMALLNQAMPLLQKYNTTALGISVDSPWCHLAFTENRKFHFPLLSDFEPKGQVSKLYDTYNHEEGYSNRSLYLLDEDAIIRWCHFSPVGVNPGVDGIFDALEALAGGN